MTPTQKEELKKPSERIKELIRNFRKIIETFLLKYYWNRNVMKVDQIYVSDPCTYCGKKILFKEACLTESGCYHFNCLILK